MVKHRGLGSRLWHRPAASPENPANTHHLEPVGELRVAGTQHSPGAFPRLRRAPCQNGQLQWPIRSQHGAGGRAGGP